MEVNNLKVFSIQPAKNPEKLLRPPLPYPYWMSAGTALGLYRDGDFIAGDTDVDVAAIGYDGIDIDTSIALEGYELFRTTYHEGKVMQMAFLKDDILDIYFHWQEGENYVNHGESGRTVMPKDIYNPVLLETKYGALPFPNPIETYLEIRYGKDWKIPQDKKPIFV